MTFFSIFFQLAAVIRHHRLLQQTHPYRKGYPELRWKLSKKIDTAIFFAKPLTGMVIHGFQHTFRNINTVNFHCFTLVPVQSP